MGKDRCLVIFTKPALPGRVKTRLVGALSSHQAAALHNAFLADLCARFSSCDYPVWLAWALEAGEEIPAASFPGFQQEGEDLGERQLRALLRAASCHALAVVVGSDHPTLSDDRVSQAFDLLQAGEDLVLGPARDGGYYLLGARPEALCAELFANVSWSTDQVLKEMLANAARLGLSPRLLPEERDVDIAADLEWLAERLSRETAACPETRSLLIEWGWLHSEVAQ